MKFHGMGFLFVETSCLGQTDLGSPIHQYVWGNDAEGYGGVIMEIYLEWADETGQ